MMHEPKWAAPILKQATSHPQEEAGLGRREGFVEGTGRVGP